MKREDPQFKLRLPEDLKTKLDEAAAASQRSISAEIVHRLTTTFDGVERDAGSKPLTKRDLIEVLRQWLPGVETKPTIGLAVTKRKTLK